MKVQYDHEVDTAYVCLSDAPIGRAEEESDVCILDFNSKGCLVVIELLSVFGFAGASLQGIVRRGLFPRQEVDQLLKELRSELVAA